LANKYDDDDDDSAKYLWGNVAVIQAASSTLAFRESQIQVI